MKRIGMLTSGGDCQALNATMRGVAKGLYNTFEDVEVYGFLEGYKGLIYGNYVKMKPSDFSGILTKGGTILGSSRQPFKLIDEPSQEGLNVIGLPKTIDNDIWGTDMTFGFQSAVDVATQAIDCIHTTACSHNRVFIVEVMGHKVGWITLHAGIASGADIILIPEIPYDIAKVCEALDRRTKQGKGFSILAVAEGAISKEVAALPKKERKAAVAAAAAKYPSVAYEVADKIKEYSGMDIRVTVPGHTQRGGSPDPYDRVISSLFGAEAVELIKNKDFGKLVVMRNNEVTAIPMEESAGKLKYVSPDDSIVKYAKRLGISFGDE